MMSERRTKRGPGGIGQAGTRARVSSRHKIVESWTPGAREGSSKMKMSDNLGTSSSFSLVVGGTSTEEKQALHQERNLWLTFRKKRSTAPAHRHGRRQNEGERRHVRVRVLSE
mmetsp:Transcript_14967/g.33024  ORF Transcript_14967/g.33024 Transcript_14967/m.33024 type:complete len:113 (-) Transcript_14967:171-509(-)